MIIVKEHHVCDGCRQELTLESCGVCGTGEWCEWCAGSLRLPSNGKPTVERVLLCPHCVSDLVLDYRSNASMKS